MKAKPLYRSATFWLGLFVLGFLLRVRGDSMRYWSEGYCATAQGRVVRFALASSCLEFQTWRDPLAFGHVFMREKFRDGPVEHGMFWPRFDVMPSQSPLFARRMTAPVGSPLIDLRPDVSRLVLTYEFVIAVWLCLWLGLLLWRARRIRRWRRNGEITNHQSSNHQSICASRGEDS
jgi:hypothetical protein